MNKKTRTVAFFIILCMAAVSCQKENISNPISINAEITSSQNVSYMIDGTTYQIILHNQAEWDAFIQRMLALARNGHSIVLSNGESVATVSSTKEIVTFTTDDENEANAWATEMIKDGYSVTITFDKKTGIYTCIAVK